MYIRAHARFSCHPSFDTRPLLPSAGSVSPDWHRATCTPHPPPSLVYPASKRVLRLHSCVPPTPSPCTAAHVALHHQARSPPLQCRPASTCRSTHAVDHAHLVDDHMQPRSHGLPLLPAAPPKLDFDFDSMQSTQTGFQHGSVQQGPYHSHLDPGGPPSITSPHPQQQQPQQQQQQQEVRLQQRPRLQPPSQYRLQEQQLSSQYHLQEQQQQQQQQQQQLAGGAQVRAAA
jgi:hypothetical protein